MSYNPNYDMREILKSVTSHNSFNAATYEEYWQRREWAFGNSYFSIPMHLWKMESIFLDFTAGEWYAPIWQSIQE